MLREGQFTGTKTVVGHPAVGQRDWGQFPWPENVGFRSGCPCGPYGSGYETPSGNARSRFAELLAGNPGDFSLFWPVWPTLPGFTQRVGTQAFGDTQISGETISAGP